MPHTQEHLGIRLQLTVPALERLIGGDDEVQLELRNAIVENFAQKKLRNLLSDTQVKGLLQEVKKRVADIQTSLHEALDQHVTSTFGRFKDAGWRVGGGRRYQFEFNEPYKEAFEAAVRQGIDEHLADVEKQAATRLAELTEQLNRRIDRKVEEVVQRLVTNAFEQRVQDEIQRRIAALANGA